MGFRIASARRMVDAHHSASSTSGSDYDSFGRARLTRHDSLTAASVKMDPHTIYGGPPSKVSEGSYSMKNDVEVLKNEKR